MDFSSLRFKPDRGRGTFGLSPSFPAMTAPVGRPFQTGEIFMLKFIGGTIGVIFLIGLIVVILLLKLIF